MVDNLIEQSEELFYSAETLNNIYTTVTLASYVNNDPVEVYNKKLQNIKMKKNKLLMELEVLKQ